MAEHDAGGARRPPVTPRTGAPAALAVLGALLAAGCGDGRGGADGAAARAVAPVVRDSAGITIVENAAPTWQDGAGWRVGDEPLLQVGAIEGPEAYQLDQVRHATLMNDGRLVIADGGSVRIRIYDADGRHLADTGGRGAGPGEFQQLARVGAFRGDSIAAWDATQRRFSIFDGEGRFARDWTTSAVGGMFVGVSGWFDDGSLVLTPGPTGEEIMAAEPGERRPARTFVRAYADGSVDTIAAVRGAEEVVYRGATVGTYPVLFGRDSYAAIDGEGLVIGENDRFELQYRRPDGALRMLVRAAVDPRPVTADEVAALREERREARRASRQRLAQMMGQALAEDETPEPPHRPTHPFFVQLLVDSRGNTWARESDHANETPRRWQVFDGDGRWLGQVTTPAGLRVVEIGDRHVIGVYRDDFEVEYVHVLELIRSGRS